MQERDDIVALDSAIILHPRRGRRRATSSGFTDPLVDCRTCKLRFRADHLTDPEHEEVRCGRKPSKRPGETPGLRPHRGAPVQPDVQDARSARSRRRAPTRTCGPETAQGIFVNFKNVAQLARRKPPFGIAQIGKSFRNEITPGNFLFRTREFEQMEMEFFVPPDEAEQWYRYWVDERLGWYLRYGIRAEPPARARARRRRALALLERHERHRVPLPDRLVGARGHREPRRLRPAPARRVLGRRSSSGSARTASATSRT